MICFDESGNSGYGGGRYFVIVAVEADNPNRLKNLAKRFCARKGLPEIKGSELKFPDRQALINTLTHIQDYRVSYLVLDKEHYQRKDMLGQNVLFNYLASFVCEDIFRNASSDIELCFDNRTVKTGSKYSLPDYLKAKSIEWNIPHKIGVSFHESHCHRGIQIADLVANTIFQKYRYGNEHFYKQLNVVKSIKFPYQHFGS